MMDYMSLGFQPGVSRVGLRELNGYDEQTVDGIGTASAVDLLDRLIFTDPATSSAVKTAKLTATDRDSLLVAIYIRTYGENIQSTLPCRQCGVAFDLSFSLKELQASLFSGARQTQVSRQDNGTFLLAKGQRFRLPTAEDEYGLSGVRSEEVALALLNKCLLEGDPEADLETVQTAMAEIAPLIDTDLTVRCPECSTDQPVHFDIQSYLLTALGQEKSRLIWEIHRLAMAYGWSYAEILGLPRHARRRHVALIESELPSLRRFAI